MVTCFDISPAGMYASPNITFGDLSVQLDVKGVLDASTPAIQLEVGTVLTEGVMLQLQQTVADRLKSFEEAAILARIQAHLELQGTPKLISTTRSIAQAVAYGRSASILELMSEAGSQQLNSMRNDFCQAELSVCRWQDPSACLAQAGCNATISSDPFFPGLLSSIQSLGLDPLPSMLAMAALDMRNRALERMQVAEAVFHYISNVSAQHRNSTLLSKAQVYSAVRSWQQGYPFHLEGTLAGTSFAVELDGDVTLSTLENAVLTAVLSALLANLPTTTTLNTTSPMNSQLFRGLWNWGSTPGFSARSFSNVVQAPLLAPTSWDPTCMQLERLAAYVQNGSSGSAVLPGLPGTYSSSSVANALLTCVWNGLDPSMMSDFDTAPVLSIDLSGGDGQGTIPSASNKSFLSLEIDLSNNRFQGDLHPLLPLAGLRALYLSNNKLNSGVSTLAQLSKLELVDVSLNPEFEANSSACWQLTLQNQTQLQSLDARRSGLDQANTSVATCLTQSSNLVTNTRQFQFTMTVTPTAAELCGDCSQAAREHFNCATLPCASQPQKLAVAAMLASSLNEGLGRCGSENNYTESDLVVMNYDFIAGSQSLVTARTTKPMNGKLAACVGSLQLFASQAVACPLPGVVGQACNVFCSGGFAWSSSTARPATTNTAQVLKQRIPHCLPLLSNEYSSMCQTVFENFEAQCAPSLLLNASALQSCQNAVINVAASCGAPRIAHCSNISSPDVQMSLPVGLRWRINNYVHTLCYSDEPTCRLGEFLDQLGGRQFCAPLTMCDGNKSYISTQSTATSDRACSPRTWTCSASQYLKVNRLATQNNECLDCTLCHRGQYQSQSCQVEADAICSTCKPCTGARYTAVPCAATNQTVCRPCERGCQSCTGPRSTDCKDKRKWSLAAIAGLSAGGCLLLILAVVGIVIVSRRSPRHPGYILIPQAEREFQPFIEEAYVPEPQASALPIPIPRQMVSRTEFNSLPVNGRVPDTRPERGAFTLPSSYTMAAEVEARLPVSSSLPARLSPIFSAEPEAAAFSLPSSFTWSPPPHVPTPPIAYGSSSLPATFEMRMGQQNLQASLPASFKLLPEGLDFNASRSVSPTAEGQAGTTNLLDEESEARTGGQSC
jgi:hypothetical protein